MSIILPLLQNLAQKDDTAVIITQDQLLAASARIAVVMGKSYGPFVPSVLPHLLRRAKEETDVSITVSVIVSTTLVLIDKFEFSVSILFS